MVSGTIKRAKLKELSKTYYESGELEAEANFKNGKLDGLYRKYSQNGQMHT